MASTKTIFDKLLEECQEKAAWPARLERTTINFIKISQRITSIKGWLNQVINFEDSPYLAPSNIIWEDHTTLKQYKMVGSKTSTNRSNLWQKRSPLAQRQNSRYPTTHHPLHRRRRHRPRDLESGAKYSTAPCPKLSRRAEAGSNGNAGRRKGLSNQPVNGCRPKPCRSHGNTWCPSRSAHHAHRRRHPLLNVAMASRTWTLSSAYAP